MVTKTVRAFKFEGHQQEKGGAMSRKTAEFEGSCSGGDSFSLHRSIYIYIYIYMHTNPNISILVLEEAESSDAELCGVMTASPNSFFE
jgi:hypothetical protein